VKHREKEERLERRKGERKFSNTASPGSAWGGTQSHEKLGSKSLEAKERGGRQMRVFHRCRIKRWKILKGCEKDTTVSGQKGISKTDPCV